MGTAVAATTLQASRSARFRNAAGPDENHCVTSTGDADETQPTWCMSPAESAGPVGPVTRTSAIFTTALNDQVVFIHPCKGVKTPTVPQKPRTIITPEQFGRVLEALPDDTMPRPTR